MTAQPFATEAEAMTHLMDNLPIYATKIGYRTDSTEAEATLGQALFAVHEKWLEVKPS